MKNTHRMKVALLLLGLCISTTFYAHTSYPDSITCPIDGEKFVIYVTMSYTTFNTLKDFQKQGAIGDLYESYVNGCPKCHYSGYRGDFDTTFTEATKQEILKILAPYKQSTLNDVLEQEIAVEIHKYFKRKNDDIANLYLVASYFLRGDSTQTAKRKELQLNCAAYLIKAIDNKEYEHDYVYASIDYLIGEMYRRTGEFEKAIKYYDLAINDPNKKDWVEKIAKEQKAMAEKKDANNDI